VVAAEVRSLAQRSAEAAREIKGLIANSVERVEQGTALVDQAGTAMAEVVQAIGRVAGIVGEMNRAAAEHGSGVSQLDSALREMDAATQEQAMLAARGTAAAQGLAQQARLLAQGAAGSGADAPLPETDDGPAMPQDAAWLAGLADAHRRDPRRASAPTPAESL
jgi:methyl-accepting chemotaxis protein